MGFFLFLLLSGRLIGWLVEFWLACVSLLFFFFLFFFLSLFFVCWLVDLTDRARFMDGTPPGTDRLKVKFEFEVGNGRKDGRAGCWLWYGLVYSTCRDFWCDGYNNNMMQWLGTG